MSNASYNPNRKSFINEAEEKMNERVLFDDGNVKTVEYIPEEQGIGVVHPDKPHPRKTGDPYEIIGLPANHPDAKPLHNTGESHAVKDTPNFCPKCGHNLQA